MLSPFLMYWIEKKDNGTGYQLMDDNPHEAHRVIHAEDQDVRGLALKVAALVKSHSIEGAYTHTPARKNTLNGEELEEFWRMFYKSI